jgi:glycosyltransferase involved in cell wall biosynthesis
VAGSLSRKTRPIPEKWAHFKNVSFLGKIANAELAKYERAADVFLFTHLNPPCPNNILEAMACGLPICGVADGAMPELIEPGKNGLLISAAGDGFWKKRTLDLEKFADNIENIFQNKIIYQKESRRLAEERFSLDSMLAQYITVLQKLL